MDIPAPSIKISKVFNKISYKNQEYLLRVKLTSSNIEIYIETINSIPKTIYKQSYSLEKLKLINKYFRVCEEIGETYQVIISILESKKLELKELINAISLIIITNDMWKYGF